MMPIQFAGCQGDGIMPIPLIIDEIYSKVQSILISRKQSPKNDLACDAAIDTVMEGIGKSFASLTEINRMTIRGAVRVLWKESNWPTKTDVTRYETIPVRSAVLVDYVNRKIMDSRNVNWSKFRAAEVGITLDSSGSHQVGVTRWSMPIPPDVYADAINRAYLFKLGAEWHVQD
jgi:hypothetical protein